MLVVVFFRTPVRYLHLYHSSSNPLGLGLGPLGTVDALVQFLCPKHKPCFFLSQSFRSSCFFFWECKLRTGIRLRHLRDPLVPEVPPCRNDHSNDSWTSEPDADGVEVGGLVDRGPAEVAEGLLEEEGSGGHGGLVRVRKTS